MYFSKELTQIRRRRHDAMRTTFLERGELLMDVPINRNDIVVILMAIQTLVQFWDYRNKKRFITINEVIINPVK